MARITPEQHQYLNRSDLATLSVSDLTDKTPRTLAYGYSINRNRVHTYLGDDGLIHLFEYDNNASVVVNHIAEETFSVSDFHPGKRTFPERTDYEFAMLVHSRGGDLCFTNYTEDVPEAIFYGAQHSVFIKYTDLGALSLRLTMGSAYYDPSFRNAVLALNACLDCLKMDKSLPFTCHQTKDISVVFDLDYLKRLQIELPLMELNEKASPKREDAIELLSALIAKVEDRGY